MNWITFTLADLAENSKIDIQTGPFGTQLKASDYIDEGIPVINVRNIGYGNLREDKLEFIPERVANRLKQHILQENDIVFGRKGAVDRHLIVTDNERGWVQGSDCIRLRILTEELDPRFMSYMLLREEHKKWMINQCSNKATMASLNQDVVKRISLPIPDLITQRKIVDILSSYDDLIKNNQRRIKILEQSVRLIYKEWFKHFRFPGYENKKIIEDLPEGWNRDQLKSIIGKVKRKTKIPKADYKSSGKYPCIDQSRDFIGGYTNREDSVIDIGKPIIVFGDHTRTLKFIDFKFACGADGTQLIVSKNESLSQEYLFFALDAIDLSNYFYARHFKFLKDQIILIPPKDIMEQFTDLAKAPMQQIKCLRDMNIKLYHSREILLPRLLKGELLV